MAEYIEREALSEYFREKFEYYKAESEIKVCGGYMYDEKMQYAAIVAKHFLDELKRTPSADVVEVVHGEWNLEAHSFYADNWDESIELCVYILASCSNCGEKHNPKQVFSKKLYAPEDADDDFRFDQEYEKSKALEEFKQKGYEFQNYCPNCGAKMDGERRSDE